MGEKEAVRWKGKQRAYGGQSKAPEKEEKIKRKIFLRSLQIKTAHEWW